MSNYFIFSITLISFFFLIFTVRKIAQWKIKSKTQLHLLVTHVAAGNRLNLSIKDYYQKKALGLDPVKRKILYIDLDNYIVHIVDLKDIDNCRLIKKQLGTQLELIYYDQDKAPLTIAFFNKFADPTWARHKLERRARNWEVLLNAHI